MRSNLGKKIIQAQSCQVRSSSTSYITVLSTIFSVKNVLQLLMGGAAITLLDTVSINFASCYSVESLVVHYVFFLHNDVLCDL